MESLGTKSNQYFNGIVDMVHSSAWHKPDLYRTRTVSRRDGREDLLAGLMSVCQMFPAGIIFDQVIAFRCDVSRSVVSLLSLFSACLSTCN